MIEGGEVPPLSLRRVVISLLPLPVVFASVALAMDKSGWPMYLLYWILPPVLVAISAVMGDAFLTAAISGVIGWFAPQAGWVDLPDDTINLAIFQTPVVLVAVALVTEVVMRVRLSPKRRLRRRSG